MIDEYEGKIICKVDEAYVDALARDMANEVYVKSGSEAAEKVRNFTRYGTY